MAKKPIGDIFGDDGVAAPAADFESLFAASTQIGKVRVGQVLSGELLTLGKDQCFVSTGTPIDGLIPSSDLKDEQGSWKYKKGEYVSVKVVAQKGGQILLRKEGARSSTSQAEDGVNLEDAFDMELPVDGKVVEAVKGGFRVKIGSQTAFCPLSQIDLRVDKDVQTYVGKRYDFRVIEYGEDGRKVVVSRRKVLEGMKVEAESEFLAKHKVGDIFTAKVTRLEKYGAFVEIDGGLQGLVPISELAWGRVEHASDLLSIDQVVQVSLLRAEEEADRLKLSFSVKQAGGESDPWLRVMEKYKVGQNVQGTVVRKEPYGLFVQLEAGVTALYPKSKWRELAEGKELENKKKGDLVQARIDQILFDEKKISLGGGGDADAANWTDFKASPQKMGTFADLFSKAQAGKPAKK